MFWGGVTPCIVPQADLALITEVAARMEQAVMGIQVERREELVVPFGAN